jgi:hypothetical protein
MPTALQIAARISSSAPAPAEFRAPYDPERISYFVGPRPKLGLIPSQKSPVAMQFGHRSGPEFSPPLGHIPDSGNDVAV